MIAHGRTFIRAITGEVRGLQRAVYVLALFALLSSLLALLRDRIFAHMFGAGETLDVYVAAFRIPDLLFVAMGALVSVYVLIPELSRRGESDQRDYIDTIIAGFSLLVIVLCGSAALIAPYILSILFPQFVALGLLPELTLLTRIMLLQPVLLGLSNILGAITQSRHRYILYAISQPLYNVGIIIGAVVFYPMFGISGLALGVVLGAFFHMGIQLPSIVADGYLRRLPRLLDPRVLFSTAAVSVPRALALSMNQITFSGLIALAGLLPTGSIAVFNFAFNLQSVPLAIIGASYSVAAFPGLAAAIAAGERGRFLQQMATAARYVIFWSLPATALIIVLRAHIVRVVLGSGAFDWTDTRLTAACFALFALSLVAQGLSLLIVRAYYASGRTFVPFLVSFGMAAGTILVGAVSVGALHIPFVSNGFAAILRVADVPGITVLALPFAYALSSVVGVVALLVHFEKRFGGFWSEIRRSIFEAIASALCGAIAAYLILYVTGPITLASTVLNVFLHGFAAGVGGIVAASALYWFLGSREYMETLQAMKSRIPSLRKQADILRPEIVAASEEHI